MYPVTRILATAGFDPAQVERRCRVVNIDALEVRPAPAMIQRLWFGPVAAMTMPWAIYVRPDVLTGDRRRLAALLLHELVHAGQWQRLGVARFLSIYVGDYLAARLRRESHEGAYRGIRLEWEARRIAGV